MKFMLRKLNRISLFSLVLVASWVSVTFGATQDVRVTNWPSSYSASVSNSTWDQRLATIQTTLQTQSANISTLVSRFGWNGSATFSDGFEMLYNDVHSLATGTSQSDLLTAFNREFPTSVSGTVKGRIQSLQAILLGSTPGILTQSSASLSSIDSYTQHIDSDLHLLNSSVSAIAVDVSSIDDNVLASKNLLDANLPGIKVDTGNIDVDTGHISSYTNQLNSKFLQFYNMAMPLFANISNRSTQIQGDVDILQEFFADSDTVAQKAAAEAASDSALNNFTGSGSASASASDYAGVADATTKLDASFHTGQLGYNDAFITINRQPTGVDSPWAWFSQATYDSINPAPTRGGALNPDDYFSFYEDALRSESRKGVSDTPFLDSYNEALNNALGGVK